MAPGPTTLILDIETVPDDELYVAPEPRPGLERPFPPLYACRPVVIGVIWLDETLTCKRMGIIGEDKSEGQMMSDFSEFVGRYNPLVVTWNGRSFDLPVLALRALRHGVYFSWYYRGSGFRYRFSEEGHLDLGDVLADFGAARMTSLDGAARLIGLPGKVGVDGTQVEGLYRAGQIDVLRRYCLSDVAQTTLVFLRYKLVSGAITKDAYRKAVGDLLVALAADGRFEVLLSGTDRARLLLLDAPESSRPADAASPDAATAPDAAGALDPSGTSPARPSPEASSGTSPSSNSSGDSSGPR